MELLYDKGEILTDRIHDELAQVITEQFSLGIKGENIYLNFKDVTETIKPIMVEVQQEPLPEPEVTYDEFMEEIVTEPIITEKQYVKTGEEVAYTKKRVENEVVGTKVIDQTLISHELTGTEIIGQDMEGNDIIEDVYEDTYEDVFEDVYGDVTYQDIFDGLALIKSIDDIVKAHDPTPIVAKSLLSHEQMDDVITYLLNN